MIQFEGIGPETGYSQVETKPFFVVPYKGINLLVLRNGKGWRVRPGDSRLGFNELSTNEVSDATREYVFGMRHLGGQHGMDALKELWTTTRVLMNTGARIFAIRAKGTGLSYVEAESKGQSVRVDVAVLVRKTYKVAFRFLHHPDGARSKPMTAWKHDDVKTFVSQLNNIFIPQVNIGFELADIKDTITRDLGQPLTTDMFEKFVVQDRSATADLTVFLVGRWAADSSHPNGTYFKLHKSTVVCDKPIHPEDVAADPFILTLAHETAHFLQHVRNTGGHHGRKGVLLSEGIQGTLIDKQLAIQLQAW